MTAPLDEQLTVLRDVLVPKSLIGSTVAASASHESDCLRGDLVVRNRRVAVLRPGAPGAHPRVVLPAPVEAHCHLDKCHTVNRLDTVGGDLSAAIEAQRLDKASWREDDIRARATKGLQELRSAGCRLVRSHVDWGDTVDPPLAWSVLRDLGQGFDDLDLDLAALTGTAQLADVAFAKDLARQLQRDGGTIGAFVLDQPERIDGVHAAFAMADRFGLALDFHVDEGLAPGLDGLELIARTAIQTGFQGPLLCGHAVSLMNAQGAELARLLDLIAQSGMAVAALPTTNLYLQGRVPGTPDRRGLTRLRELHNAGVPIVIGSDNVADAFCPTGQHDPMAALNLAILAGHLDPPFGRWLEAITVNAARVLGRAPQYVIGASVEALRLCHASSLPDLISGRCGPLEPLTPYLEELT